MSPMILLLSLALPNYVFGMKKLPMSFETMVQRSDVIAIVTLIEAEMVETKGSKLIFFQKSKVKVDKVLKGTLGAEAFLYGNEEHQDRGMPMKAPFKLRSGQYLVFLRWDGPLLVGVNGSCSSCKILGVKVEWFDPNGTDQRESAPLTERLQQILRFSGNSK